MPDQDFILFLLGVDQTGDQESEYLVQADPEATVVDAREADAPTWIDDISSGRISQSRRARGPHLPTILDVAEGTPEPPSTIAPGTTAPAQQAIEAPPLESGVDDREGPASNRIAVQERILSRNRIREFARSIARYRSVGVLNSAYHAPVQARAMRFDAQREEIGWRIDSPEIEAPFVVEIAGYNSVYQFPVESASVREDLVFTPLPREAVRVRRRWSRRTLAPEGCTVDLHLGDEQPVLTGRQLRDVSFRGLSFWNDPQQFLIHADTRIELIVVHAPALPPMRFRASLRFVAATPGQLDSCGLLLEPVGADDANDWHGFLCSLLYPTTRDTRGLHEAVWTLFRESGYFNLSNKQVTDFEPLHADFETNTSTIERHPELGFIVVWPVAETATVFATMTVLKVYQGSWFYCQLAKLAGDDPHGASGRQILRDIHLHCYEHIQLDPGFRWLIGYSQVKNVWTRSVLYDMPRRYIHAGLACVVRFRALHVATRSPLPAGAPDVEVGPATREEIDLFLRRLSDERPRSYLDALDFTPEHLDLAENTSAWASAGLPREREFHVARRHGRPLAITVVESAAPGLHLFRFLDLVRPYPLIDDFAEAAPAMDALLEHARLFYLRRQRSVFACFIEDDAWLTDEVRRNIQDLGLADMTVLSAHILPELLEHLLEITAPRTMPSIPAVQRKPSP